jgi:hypothetical protein
MIARIITCFLLSFLVNLASSCAMAQQDSTSLFTVLGMLDDYAARRAYVGDSLVGDVQESLGEVFGGYLDRMRSNLGCKGEIRREMRGEGGIRFFSIELAAAVDSCFVFDYSRSFGQIQLEGEWVAAYHSQRLKSELIASAFMNDSHALAFLRGIYLTNGWHDMLMYLDPLHARGAADERDPIKRSHLVFSGYSFYKASLADSLLHHFNCQNIDFSVHGGIPGSKEIHFDPSPTILFRVMLPAIEEFAPYEPAPCNRQ